MADYKPQEGKRVCLEFIPVEKCPRNENYIIRAIERFEIVDKEGKLVKDLLNKKEYMKNKI